MPVEPLAAGLAQDAAAGGTPWSPGGGDAASSVLPPPTAMAGSRPPVDRDPTPSEAAALSERNGVRLGPLAARVEAALFAAAEPVSLERLARVCGEATAQVRLALAELASHLDAHGHATMVTELGGGFQVLTRPEFAEVVAGGGGVRTPPLSRAALETLSIIAFWQPVTRATVDEMRGVHSEGAIATLLERGLVAEKGRADAPGRPFLYATTRRFLEYFGLRSLEELAAAEGVPAVPRPERWSMASPAGPREPSPADPRKSSPPCTPAP